MVLGFVEKKEVSMRLPDVMLLRLRSASTKRLSLFGYTGSSSDVTEFFSWLFR